VILERSTESADFDLWQRFAEEQLIREGPVLHGSDHGGG